MFLSFLPGAYTGTISSDLSNSLTIVSSQWKCVKSKEWENAMVFSIPMSNYVCITDHLINYGWMCWMCRISIKCGFLPILIEALLSGSYVTNLGALKFSTRVISHLRAVFSFEHCDMKLLQKIYLFIWPMTIIIVINSHNNSSLYSFKINR